MTDSSTSKFNSRNLIDHLDHNLDHLVEHNGGYHTYEGTTLIKIARNIKPSKTAVCVDVATISLSDAIWHITFLPGANKDDIEAISKAMSRFED